MILHWVVSGGIFVLTLYLIFTERLNRSIASALGAMLMVGAGLVLDFYHEEQAIEAVDFETIGLLVGMMILVAIIEPTGFFQFLAVWAARLSRGSPVRLFVLLGTVTTLLSMVLDNVTTVVLIAPVTILISEILGIDVIPLLIAEALLSNTGGVATLVGDPPNILIASAAGFSFNDFLVNSLPIVAVAWFSALALLRFLFRKEFSMKPQDPDSIFQLDPVESLHDPVAVRKVLIVLGLTLLAFFFQELLHVTPAMIALSAATIALVWTQPDIRLTLERVEWSVIFFFSALFVMVGGLEASGLLGLISQFLANAQEFPLVVYGILLIWIVAGLSAIVDNVPMTIAMIPVIQGLGETGIDIIPLWWALAFGAGFGGNGTIIGSSANIVVASLSERTPSPITSALWNKRGLPVMILTCFVASILYAIFFPYF